MLKSKKIGTKNLPDAIKWHFASYWKHAISKKEINRLDKSHDKLKKHIAIPILLKKKLNIYKEIANKIIEC